MSWDDNFAFSPLPIPKLSQISESRVIKLKNKCPMQVVLFNEEVHF